MGTRDDKLYSEEHIWIKIDEEYAYIGITDYLQDKLGDISFIDIAEEGTNLEIDDEFASIEASKIATELISPIGGQIYEINSKLQKQPQNINKNPEDTWIIKVIDYSQLDNLYEWNEYKNIIKE